MSSGHGLSLAWTDICVVVIVLFGLWRGRRRGISVELPGTLQWLAIVVVGGLTYRPLALKLSPMMGLSLGYAQVTAYLAVMCVIHFLFSWIKRRLSDSLDSSDAFGGWEYRLGLVAGGLRHACLVMVFLALLHSRHIDKAERAAIAKMQADNFGSISFPTLGSVHQTIFDESMVGNWVKTNLAGQLIQPVRPGPAPNILPKTIVSSETLQILNQP